MTSEQKSIFITGSASGLGLATARLFADKGWFVAGYDVNRTALESLASELGDRGIAESLDVTDRSAFAAALERFGKRTGGTLDLLFNNAGTGAGGPLADMPFEDIERVINVNLMGVINGIYEALPLLRATPNALCFTTSSSSGIYGVPGLAIYSATKHAVKGLTEALAVEFASYGIRAADVLPGNIDTPLLPDFIKTAAPRRGMWRLMPSPSVAEVVWKAYHDTKLHWYVPEELMDRERTVVADVEAVRDAFTG